MSKIKGRVVASYYEKSLIEVAEGRYYIIKGLNPIGETVSFEPAAALLMPSFLFALAAMNEEDLTGTLDFIKSNWVDLGSSDNNR